MNYITICDKLGHNQQQIYALCIEPDCEEQRSCCGICINKDHSTHKMSVQKLDELKANYSKEKQTNGLLDELKNRIIQLLNLIDSDISESQLIYPEMINLTNLNLIGLILSSSSETLTYQKLKKIIDEFTMVIGQLNKQILSIMEIKEKKEEESHYYQRLKLSIDDTLVVINQLDTELLSLKTSEFQMQLKHQIINYKGNALLWLGNYKEAILYFDKAISIQPNNDDYYNNQGNALFKLKRYREAIQYFDKAISIQPNNNQYYQNKADALYCLKRDEEAIKQCYKGMSIQPNKDLHYDNKGVEIYKLSRCEDAIQYYDKAISTQPNNDEYYNNKGNALSEMKRYKEAIQYYDKAISIKSNNDKYYNNKANALFYLAKYEKSLIQQKKANEIQPSLIYNTNQGLTLEKLGKRKGAYWKYDQALKIDPKNKTAIDRINKLNFLNTK